MSAAATAAQQGADATASMKKACAGQASYVPAANLLGVKDDELQLDAGYGVGCASGGRFDSGGALAIRQAF